MVFSVIIVNPERLFSIKNNNAVNRNVSLFILEAEITISTEDAFFFLVANLI